MTEVARAQIQRVLSRELIDADFELRRDFTELSELQRETARVLANRSMVLGAIYLKTCTEQGLMEIINFMDEDLTDYSNS